MIWTDEMIGTLTRMWLDGSTSSQISRALGTVTRNSVMGKVNRLGLIGSADHNSRSSHVAVGCCRPKSPSTVSASMEIPSDGMVVTTPMHADVPSLVDETRCVVVDSGPPLRKSASDVAMDLVTVPVVEVIACPVEIGDSSKEVDDPSSGPLDDTHAAQPSPPSEPEMVAETGSDPGVVPIVETDQASSFSGEGPDRSTGLMESESPSPESESAVAAAPPAPRRPVVRSLIRDSLRAASSSIPKPKVQDDSSVVRLSTGTIAKCCSLVSSDVRPDWRTAVGLVEELTGQRYDWEKCGHRSSVVAISTILGKGDPRRILLPKMKEPAILVTMRSLALGGLIVGGKTPTRWHDEVTGDTAFFDDMLMVEEVTDAPRIENRVTA